MLTCRIRGSRIVFLVYHSLEPMLLKDVFRLNIDVVDGMEVHWFTIYTLHERLSLCLQKGLAVGTMAAHGRGSIHYFRALG